LKRGLIPIKKSTKDRYFSTLYLSPTVTKTGECSFFVSKRLKSGNPRTRSTVVFPW
jgi:hypothetical protein